MAAFAIGCATLPRTSGMSTRRLVGPSASPCASARPLVTFRRRSGIRSFRTAIVAGVLAAASCFPYGFAGGGLPRHIDTVAVIPFENETSTPEIQRELFESLRKELQGRLGLRDAAEAKADAVVRGVIVRYDVDVPIGYSADRGQVTSSRRKLQLVVDVSIVDQSTGKTLWERKGLTAEGEYSERAEPAGRRIALQRVVNEVVEGAQSQW